MNVTLKKLQGSVFGAAIGDAVGVPFEFRSREEMMRCPATGMTGNGTYHMPIGTWSDDTTMTLCTLDRLDESMDYDGIMRAFLSWVEKGEYTPHGSCFDIGGTTRRALENFARGAEPLRSGLDDNYSNGNGSLMRIIPAALYADAHGLSLPEAVKLAETLSSLTHAHAISRTGCGIFTCIALSLLKNADKSSVQEGIRNAAAVYTTESGSKGIEKYRRLLSDGFAALPQEKIRSSGYVVDTLECAVWCLLQSDSYSDCILKAVNFGNDTDTAACVAGALAGLLYGYEGIPEKWRGALVKTDLINDIIDGFCRRNGI